MGEICKSERTINVIEMERTEKGFFIVGMHSFPNTPSGERVAMGYFSSAVLENSCHVSEEDIKEAQKDRHYVCGGYRVIVSRGRYQLNDGHGRSLGRGERC